MENLLKNDFLETITSYFRKPWKFYTFEQLLELEGILRLLKMAVLEKMTILIEAKTIQADIEKDLIQILRKFREFQEKILFFDLKVDYDYLLDLPFLPIMLKSLNSELIYEILFFLYNLVFIGNNLKKLSEDQKNLFFIFLSVCLNLENYDKNIVNYYEYVVNANNFNGVKVKNSLENKKEPNENEISVLKTFDSGRFLIDNINKNEINKNPDSNTEFLNYFQLIKDEVEGNNHKLFDEINYLILKFDFKTCKKDFPKKSEEISSLIKTKIRFFKTKFQDRLYTILSNIIMSELVTLGVKSLLISENNSNSDLPLNSFSSNFREMKRSLLNLIKLEYLPMYLIIRSFETLSLSTFGFEKLILQKFYQPKSEICLDENRIVEAFKIKYLENEKNLNLNEKFEKDLFIWFIKLADKIRFSYESLELQMKNNTDLSDCLSKIEESRKNLDDLMEKITLSVFENADLSVLIENIDLLIPIVVYFKTIYNQEKNRFFTCLFKNLLTLIDLCLSSPSFLQSQTFMEKVFDKYNEIEECILQLLQLFFVFETRTIFTENLNKEIISIDFFRKIMEIRMILSSMEKNKTYSLIDFLSHFAFNQILFHSLTNDNNVMRDHVIELLEGDENLRNFLIIFDSFYNSNKVIFLCNFNLLRKRVLKILDDHMHNLNKILEKDKETEIVKVYAKTYAYCFLLWADTSSLENDFIELKVLKPFYELSFEALFEKMSFSMGFDAEHLKILEKNGNNMKILEQDHNSINGAQSNLDLINISEEKSEPNLFEPKKEKDKSNNLEKSQVNQSILSQKIKKNKIFLNLLKQALSTKYHLVFENSLFFLKSIMFKLYEEKIPIEKFRYYIEKILILNSPLIGSFEKVREIKEIRINGFYDFSFESSQKQEGIKILYILFEMMRERYIWRRNKMEEFWIKLQFLDESESFQIVHSQEEKECELLVMIISEFVSKMKFNNLNDKNIVDYLSDIFKCFMEDLTLYLPFLIQMHSQKFNQMRNPFNNKDNDEDHELMRRVDKIKYSKNFILRILKQIPLFLNLYKMFFSFIEKTSPKTPHISIEFRKLNYFLLKNMTSISMTLFEISNLSNNNLKIKHNYDDLSQETGANQHCNCNDENSNANFECKCCISDLRILFRIITGFEILKKTCESLHESKLPLLFLNDSFLIKLRSILTYIHSLLKSNQIDYLLIQSTETEQGYCFTQGRTFILVKLVQVIFNKIIINILPDFLLSELLFSEFTIINDCLFNQILEKTISIFENSILIWALIARNNEEIPIKLICIFEDFVLHPRTPRNNHRLETLAASLVSLFLKSTYVFRMRIRSIYLYKLVHKLVMLRSFQDSALFLPLKNQYLLYFIQLLTYHFREIYPLWDPFQHFPVLATLLSSSSSRLNPNLTPSSSIFLPVSPTLLLPSLSFLLPPPPPLSFCLPSRSSSLVPIPHSSPPLSSPSLHHVSLSSLPSSLATSSSLLSPSSSKIPHVASSCLFFTSPFLPPIESSCIHAMLSNLISRLLTCENSLHSEPVLDQGIRLMFWHWPASKGFCRYVIGLLRKVREKNERMSQEDLDTLHNDTIANLVEMMREEGEERRKREENSNKASQKKVEGKGNDEGEFSWSDYYELLRDFFKEYVGLREKGGGCAARAEILKEIISLLAFENNSSNDIKSKKERKRSKKTNVLPNILEKIRINESEKERESEEKLKKREENNEDEQEYEEERAINGEGREEEAKNQNRFGEEKKEGEEVPREKVSKSDEKSEENERKLEGGKEIEGERGEGKGLAEEKSGGEGEKEREVQGIGEKDEGKEEKNGERKGKIYKNNKLTRKERCGLKEIEKFLDRTLDGLKLKREGHCDYIEKFSGELLKLVDKNLKLDEEDNEKNIEFLIKAAFFNEHLGEFSPYIKLRENDYFIENAFDLDNHLFLKKLKEKCRFFRLKSDSLAISLKDNSSDHIDPIEKILFGQMSCSNRLSKNALFNILLKKLVYLIEESLENQTNPEMSSFFTIDLIIKYLSIIFSKFPLLIPHLLNYPMTISKPTSGKVSNFFIEKLARYQKHHALTFFEFVLIYYDISPNAFRQILLMITTISFHFYIEPNEPGGLISSAAKIRLILLKHFSFEFSNGYKLFSHGFTNGSDLQILSLRNNMQVTFILLKNEKNTKIIKNLLSEIKLAWIGLMEVVDRLQPAFLSILKNINFFGLLSILNKLQIQMLFEEKFQMKWQKNGTFLKNALNSYFSKNEKELIKLLDIEREKKRFEEFYNPNKNVSEELGEEIAIAGKEGESIDCKVDQNLFCPESKESMRVYGDFCFENLDNVLAELPNVERVIEKGSVLYFSYDFSVSSNYILIPNLKLHKSSYYFFNLLCNLIDPSRARRIPIMELNSEENEDNPDIQENEESQEILSSTESLIVSSREHLNERSAERSMERSIEPSLEQSVERSMDQSVEQSSSQSELLKEKRKFIFFQENFQLKRLMNEKMNIDLLSKEIQKLNKNNKKKIASFLDEDLINDLNPKLKLEIKDYKKEQQIKESLNFSKNSFDNEKNDIFPNECQSLVEIPSAISSYPKDKESTSFFDFTSKFLFEVNQLEKSSLERIFLCLYLHSEKTTESESNCPSILKLLKTYLFSPTSAVLIINSLRILLVHHLEHMEPFFKITQKSQMEVSLEMINAIIGFLIKLMEKNYVLPLLFEKEVGAKNFEFSFEFLKGKVGEMEDCNFFFLMLKQLKRFEYLANMELSVNFRPVILTLTHFIKTYMVKNGDYLASEEELDLLVLIFYERKLRLKYFELSLYQFFLEYNKNHINYISFFVKIIEFYCRKLTEHLNKNEFDENFNNDFHLFRHLIKDLISLTSKLESKFFINLFESDFQDKFGIKTSTYEGNKDTLSIQLKNRIDKWVEKKKKIYISHQLKEKSVTNQIIVVFFSTLIQKICNSLSVSSAPNDLYLFFTYPIKAFLIFYQFISIPIPKQTKNKEFSSFCPIKTYTTIDKLSSTHTIEEKEVNISKSNEIINSNPSLLPFPSQITSEKPLNKISFPLLPTQTPILPPNSSKNILQNPFEFLFESLYQEELEKLMNFLIESKDNERLGNYMRYLEQADPKKIKLEIKIGYLRWITHKKLGGYRREGVVEIQIDRKKIWESTLEGLAGVEASDLAGKVVRVGFLGEEGIDYGGVTREWLSLLSEEIFNPNFGLFCLTSNSISVMPSHYSKAIPDYLNHFRFIGRLVAKSLKDNLNFEVNFPNFFLKSILGITLTIKDLSSIDGELCKNLEWILKNNVDDLDLNFSYDLNVFDIPQMIELIPNGQCIKVNEQNKKEYVKLMCYAKMFSEIKDQTLSFIKGFNEVIPKEALVLFDEKELGMKLCGLSEIDLDDLIANLEYISYSRTHPLIVWLVRILSSYDQKALAKLLFFITGSFKVPLGGFKNFKIKIERVFDKESLPSAHTCFNQLDLPEYESEEKMREKLWLAINEGNKGFYIC